MTPEYKAEQIASQYSFLEGEPKTDEIMKTKSKKQMTSDDIESATIYLHSKDGRIFVAKATEKFTILNIVANNIFVELDASQFSEVEISELIKTKQQ